MVGAHSLPTNCKFVHSSWGAGQLTAGFAECAPGSCVDCAVHAFLFVSCYCKVDTQS